jgi:prophage DNA circulation protein
MSWRDQLRAGSFRDAAFFIESAEAEVGRRNAVHEFAGSDNPDVEDLGPRSRRFKLQVYVLGPDYFDSRDALIDALEKAGPGVLVHPYWGEFEAAVTGPARVRETVDKGGYASFDIDFIRTAVYAPAVAPDTQSSVDSAAGVGVANLAVGAPRQLTGVAEVLQVSTGAALRVFGLTLAAQALLSAAFGTVLGAMRAARRGIAVVLGSIDDLESDLDDLTSAAQALLNSPLELASTIIELSGKLGALIVLGDDANQTGAQVVLPKDGGAPPNAFGSSSNALGSGAARPSASGTAAGTRSGPSGGILPPNPNVVASLLQLAAGLGGFTLPPSVLPPPQVPGDAPTPMRLQELANKAAIEQLVSLACLATCCEVAAKITYESADQALAVRRFLTDLLDNDSDTSTDDDIYGALVDLRTALLRHLSIEAGKLPSVRRYTPAQTLPALVIAHELYGDATRESELLARNDVSNPCFVRGGVPLEVLSV